MVGTLKNKGARCIYYGRPHPQRHARTHQLQVHDDLLALVSSTIPCFDGNFDPRAYIEWEVKVEKEFDDHDLCDAQMIYILLLMLWLNMLCLSGNTFVGITIFHNIGMISNSFLEKHLFQHIMSIICLQN
jgi:hypothetical protein